METCDVCGQRFAWETMKHYGREQLLDDEDCYVCQSCEAKTGERIRQHDEEIRARGYTIWPRKEHSR